MAQDKSKGSARLATRLKSLRGGLTQAQAASRSKISEATWQNLERAVVRPQPITVQRIADGFSMSFDDLWSYVDDTPPSERFTDAELDRLAARIAPLIAAELRRRD